MRSNICCFCGCKIRGYGNSCWPLRKSEDARCCDACNLDKVIPARLAELRR